MSSTTTELRETGHLEHVGQRLEEPVHEDQPPDVDASGSDVHHLPVEHRGGCEPVEEHVARPGITPVEDRGSRIRRTVGIEPGQGAFDDRQPEIAPGPVVVGALLGEQSADLVG